MENSHETLRPTCGNCHEKGEFAFDNGKTASPDFCSLVNWETYQESQRLKSKIKTQNRIGLFPTLALLKRFHVQAFPIV